MGKVKRGEITYNSGGGFGGKGLDQIERERDRTMILQKFSFGEPEEGEVGTPSAEPSQVFDTSLKGQAPSGRNAFVSASKTLAEVADRINTRVMSETADVKSGDKIAEINARFSHLGSPSSGDVVALPESDGSTSYKCELDINDYPQYVRWKVTTKDVFKRVQDMTGISITARGVYVSPNKPIPGERRLHLLLESNNESSVQRARKELLDIIIEATQEAMSKSSTELGKYSVL